MAKEKSKKRTAKRERSEPVRLPSYTARRRVLVGVMILFGLVLMWHAVDQQIFQGDFLREEGRARHLRVVDMPALRGTITDRHGDPLAISTPVDSVWADPRRLARDESTLMPLAHVLDLNADHLRRLLLRHKNRGFVYLKRRVNPEQAEGIKALDLDGIGLQREYRRFYPTAEVGTHVVGFTDIDDRGQEGIELAYQEWLQAAPGRKRVLKDGRKQAVKNVESIRAPRAGKDLALSLDRRLQYLAYRELKAAVKKHRARAGSAVILDVTTGEVLAMVNRPSYNPNGSRNSRGGGGRNRAITDLLEAGSAIKPFTVAAALELGRYRPDTLIDTSPGTLKIGRHKVKDSRDNGVIDVATVIRKSSNVGVSRMALDLSAEELWALFARFGFGQHTDSGFPGEVSGQLPHFQDWSRFEQATLSFGYGLSVTALQLARAYAALAADGLLRPVSLLRVEEAPAGERVVSAGTARAVRAMLEAVVSSDGTAPLARVPGYRVGGKTGTARKLVSGSYAKDKYLAIFAGMVPVSDPRLVMVVIIDEPTAGQYYGGQVAAPVFSKVMGGALRLMNVPPDDYGPSGLRLASSAEGRP